MAALTYSVKMGGTTSQNLKKTYKTSLVLSALDSHYNYSLVFARVSQYEKSSLILSFSGQEPMATLQYNFSENFQTSGVNPP